MYAAVKTGTDTKTNPSSWCCAAPPAAPGRSKTAYIGSTNVTRPLLQLDATHHTAEVFVTGPEAPGGKGEDGGAIYRKSAPLATLAFGAGLGERVMGRPTTGLLNDVSGTKQPVTSATGLTAIAADSTTRHYWHHNQSLVQTAPTAPSGVTVQAGIGKVKLSWTAATPGDVAIDHYRVTATPALPASPLPDYPASATGALQTDHSAQRRHPDLPRPGRRRRDHGPCRRQRAGDARRSTCPSYVGHVRRPAGPGLPGPPGHDGREDRRAQRARRWRQDRPAGDPGQPVLRQRRRGGRVTAAARRPGSPGSTSPTSCGPPDKGGYDYWLRQLKSGQSLEAISRYFAASPEFNSRYGPLTNDGFVSLVYRNLFDRSPDSGGKTYWLNKLASGFPRGSMMTTVQRVHASTGAGASARCRR